MNVRGFPIDQQTRCTHYHGWNDIIAIKFACCHEYYPCYQCHEKAADHQIKVWPRSTSNTKAILCGNCKTELTINEYKQTTDCPHCNSAFNENCRLHYHLYFEK